MSDELRLAAYREPLGLWVRSGARLAERPELRIEEIEFSSRGDRVSGRVLLPASGGGPFPLLLLQDSRDDTTRDRAIEASSWAERGAAVASIDLPLCGARYDAKLAGELLPPGNGTSSAIATAFALERARQAVIDFEHALDTLTFRDWIDEERIAYVGLSDAAIPGAAFCALDPRVRAAVLEVVPGGTTPIDPALYRRRIPPRPLLELNGRPEPRDTSIHEFLSRALGLG